MLRDNASARSSSLGPCPVRRAALRAMLAPSIRNTQPWQFVLREGALDVYADFQRRLPVMDPHSRQLHISCGCAVLNARVALNAMGYRATREWIGDLEHPAHLARIRITHDQPADSALAGLDELIASRTSNRRGFTDRAVPTQVVQELTEAALAEHAVLLPISTPEHRDATAMISQRTADLQKNDPASRAEKRYWTTTDPHRRDGVRANVRLRAAGDDDGPWDLGNHRHHQSALPERYGADPCLLLLGTIADDRLSWLHTGEALERVLLVATGYQLTADIQTQVIEMPHSRAQLRSALDLSIHPHVLVRIGHGNTTPSTRRRTAEQVIRERR